MYKIFFFKCLDYDQMVGSSICMPNVLYPRNMLFFAIHLCPVGA